MTWLRFFRPTDFYGDANEVLYRHLLETHNDGCKIDATLLVERLKSAGDFERVGGTAYLARVASSVPHASHAVYYASIVHEKATYRQLIDASAETLRRAYAEDEPADELRADAEAKLFALAERGNGAAETKTAHDAMRAWSTQFEARQEGTAEHGIQTGFDELDRLTNGMRAGELVILAARPSMGKTALACNIAERLATVDRIGVLFVSMEMSTSEMSDRIVSSQARVNAQRV